MDVVIFGAGNMGAAFARGILARRLAPSPRVTLIERNSELQAELVKESRWTVQSHLAESIPADALLVLAVKPQEFSEAAAQIRPFVREDQLVLSFMAGVTMGRIHEQLPGIRCVRSMPNLPFMVSEGMTVFIAEPAVNGDEVARIMTLLDCCGRSLRVDREILLDAATAVSGTGPAYVFLLAELLMNSAQELGFTEDEAAILVGQTFSGALELMKHSQELPNQLRARVTSKGGTTAAAMAEFERIDLASSFHQGVQRAFERSRELSGS